MNVLAIAVVLLALAQSSDSSALVEASKDAKAKRKSSTTKVITNADVARARSKVVERKGSAAPAQPTSSQTTMEKYEADRKIRLEREARLEVLDRTIAGLEQELAKIEQSYYEENDLNYRDTEIVKRFAEAKAKLDTARRERDQLNPPPAE